MQSDNEMCMFVYINVIYEYIDFGTYIIYISVVGECNKIYNFLFSIIKNDILSKQISFINCVN